MQFRHILAAGAALCAATSANARQAVQIEREVYVERTVARPDGRALRSLEPAGNLRRGDVVVLMLEWSASDRDNGFVVSSRVPRDLAFRRTGGAEAEVSIDGGRTWGMLDRLRISDRRATPEDVTHLRWQVARDDAAQGRGMLTYSALVR
jgi:hypothetical protein